METMEYLKLKIVKQGETINKLSRRLHEATNTIRKLTEENTKLEKNITPIRISLNNLTAAHSKLKRSIRRQENKNGKR